MNCSQLAIGVIVCGSKPRDLPCEIPHCGRPHTFLCDNPMIGARAGATCSRRLCDQHALPTGEDAHLCPTHARVGHAAGQRLWHVCTSCGTRCLSGRIPAPPDIAIAPLPAGWELVAVRDLDKDDALACAPCARKISAKAAEDFLARARTG